MAEFQEVMRQWSRMCNAVPGKSECINICRDKQSGYTCPMYDSGLCNKSISSQTDKDRLEGEKTVMAWVAEHPEPVYPRWVDWLVQVGVVGCETCHGHKHYFVEDDMFEHIPEETAQLLGLKPLPIVNGDCGATNEADARKKLGIKPKER